MKLLVCDIEGTIFKPHMIKDAQHASYIWTAIAARLGPDAERKEIETQDNWKKGVYGHPQSGEAYLKWVDETIKIHKGCGLRKSVFDELIAQAPYVDGVEHFFKQLNRKEYIPVFISGGIQNLNHKACRDLGVDVEDSYASCEYFFSRNGKIDETMTFSNTCNFYGKQELVQVALRKHGLSADDWIFIGDGINDVETAKSASLSIGIDPVRDLREAATYSFADFDELLRCTELSESYHLFFDEIADCSFLPEVAHFESLKEQSEYLVQKQIGHLRLPESEECAYQLYKTKNEDAKSYKNRFFGITDLLLQGELILSLLEQAGESEFASAVLQPFCSASEIMVNITLALTGKSADLRDLFDSKSTLKESIEKLSSPALRTVLHAYRINRNTIAHSYKMISAEAARSLARRTYENIQRLELIASSGE